MGIGFRGATYANRNTATDDTGRRFETSEKKLTRALIQVTGEGQNIGTSLYATYYNYYAAGSEFTLVNVDISTLYFANATAGANGTVSVLGVEAE